MAQDGQSPSEGPRMALDIALFDCMMSKHAICAMLAMLLSTWLLSRPGVSKVRSRIHLTFRIYLRFEQVK